MKGKAIIYLDSILAPCLKALSTILKTNSHAYEYVYYDGPNASGHRHKV